MISGVYQILNVINGKVYIGSAANILSRWSHHERFLEANKHHSILLQRSWNKYGADAFKFVIIEECKVEDLLKIEQLWLDASECYYPENGFNIFKIAGSPKGYKHTEEWKINNGNILRGRNHSEETRARMSIAHKNRSAEHKANHAAAMKKRGISKEHMKKLIEANKKRGYKYND